MTHSGAFGTLRVHLTAHNTYVMTRSPLHNWTETHDIADMQSADAHTHINRAAEHGDAEQFLDEAEAMVSQKGQKLTKIRRKVLKLLVESDEPAKAYDLLTQLDGEGSAKPPTIYRALDFLQEVGLVHKIESLNAYVACGHASHNHSAVFLICEACGKADELHAVETSKALDSETASVDFELKQAVIEVRGACKDCR